MYITEIYLNQVEERVKTVPVSEIEEIRQDAYKTLLLNLEDFNKKTPFTPEEASYCCNHLYCPLSDFEDDSEKITKAHFAYIFSKMGLTCQIEDNTFIFK